MDINIPSQKVPGQSIKIPSKTITVQPEPLEVNGQIIPQVAQSITIPEQVVVTAEYTIPGYTITIADTAQTPSPTPNPIPAPYQGKRFFKSDSIWNKKLSDSAPLHPNGPGYVADINAQNRKAPAWINVGTPIYIVTDKDLKAPIRLTGLYSEYNVNVAEFAAGINIPKNLVGSTVDSDKSCSIYNITTDKIYDLWQLSFVNGSYQAVSGGILPSASTSDGTFKRIAGKWNSVRAGHTPLAAGMGMKYELEAGVLPHVGALVLGNPSPSFVYPCTSSDGGNMSTNAVPYGTHFRFPANITINPAWTPLTKMLVTQGRDYGFIVVDKTGYSNVFAFEGTDQYGVPNGDLLKPYLNGKQLWDVLGTQAQDGEFPWSKLQVVM